MTQPIDVLRSRRQSETEPYFASIPKEERFAVRYLISDMNNDYLSYVGKYFPNAVSVVDSFHVIQWINAELDRFVRALQKSIAERDEKRQEELSAKAGRQLRLPMSDELYLLKNYRFFLLSNADSIKYHDEPHLDRHFRFLMRTSDYEDRFFRVDPALRELRDLKERYVRFNTVNAGKPRKAAVELDKLIEFYAHCGQDIFVRFSKLLKRHREPIINSFVLIERLDTEGVSIVSRLSNGPIESMNRKAKDLKRQARGFRNFDHLRNRFLFATRLDPELNGRQFEKQDRPHSLRYRSTVLKTRQRTLDAELESILEKYDCTEDELLAFSCTEILDNKDIFGPWIHVQIDFIDADHITQRKPFHANVMVKDVQYMCVGCVEFPGDVHCCQIQIPECIDDEKVSRTCTAATFPDEVELFVFLSSTQIICASPPTLFQQDHQTICEKYAQT